MYGLDGLRSTSAENFMSVALLQIYRLRKLVTCSILIWPAVTPLTFSHSIQHEAVTLDLLLKKKQKKTRRALSRGNSTIYTSPFSESHIIHSHTQKKTQAHISTSSNHMAQQSGWMALRTVNLHNHNKAAVLCMCAEKATHQSTLSHMNTCSFQKEGASAVTSEGFFPQRRRRRGSQISSTKRVENTKTEEGHGWGWGQRREAKRGNLREWEHSSSVLREVLHLAEAFCRSLF